jgi:bifunctional ADP-heptose synthase (sugar kinase/adenylyltransferase)
MKKGPESVAPPSPSTATGDSSSRRELVYSGSSGQAKSFLESFFKRYSLADVEACVNSVKKLRVLVVGDAIIDEYHFVAPFGMPLKAAIIAAKHQSEEAYAGGALAVANHVAGFCREVTLLTCLGDQNSYEGFIRSRLLPNVTTKFFTRPGAPTTLKRRFLQRFLLQKLFELAYFDDSPLSESLEEQIRDQLEAIIGDYDLVLVADFGHGLISPRLIDLLASKARFLALNTQLNSMNYGYNVVTKYPRAHYVCIDEPETRMAVRDRFSPIERLVPGLAATMQTEIMTVTLGVRGSLMYRAPDEYSAVPVLSRQVVDTVGAGDAFLSLTSPLAAIGCDLPLIGFIGNAAGALAVRTVGNERPVDKDNLMKLIVALGESQ